MSESEEEYDSPASPDHDGGEEENQTTQEDENKGSANQTSEESDSEESEGDGEPPAIAVSPPGGGESEGEEGSKQPPTEEENEGVKGSASPAEGGEEETKISDPFGDEGSDEDEGMSSAIASASARASRFIRESDSEEEEGKGEEEPAVMEEGEGEKEPSEARSDVKDGEEVGGAEGVVKESSPLSDDEGSPPTKKLKVDEGESGGEGGEESEGGEEGEGGEEDTSQLQQEVADLQEEVPISSAEVAVGGADIEGGEESSDDEVEGRRESTLGMSDWDIMMDRRKEAMARARRRRRKDFDIHASNEYCIDLIGGMEMAAQEDKQLNLAGKAATKKLQMLQTVITNLKNGDLQSSLISCGMYSALAEWLTPLPDHSLPHLKIRTSILEILSTYPTPDSSLLKSSKIGKAVMLLYRHPKESRKNKEKAGKLINEWARPIFGVKSDMKDLDRDKREERDYAHLSQAARRRLSSGERRASQDEEYQPQKPGDKGWVGRARVPMPSTKDYVVRPKYSTDQEFRRGPTKKVLNRYEAHLRKNKMAKQQSKATHAVSISIEGRHMPL